MLFLIRKKLIHLPRRCSFLLFFLCSTLALQGKNAPSKNHINQSAIPPDELVETFTKEYFTANARLATNKDTDKDKAKAKEHTQKSIRMILATKDIWEEETLTNLSKYPSLFEDNSSRMSLAVFFNKGKDNANAHTLLNQTALLLGIDESALFKNYLFLSLINVNGNQALAQQNQKEMRLLISKDDKDKLRYYKLHKLSKKAEKHFTTTLTYYSTQEHPYMYQEYLKGLQGKLSEKLMGKALSDLIKRFAPSFFDRTQKEPAVAYISRFFLIDSDLISFAHHLQSGWNALRKTYYIWHRKLEPGEEGGSRGVGYSLKKSWQIMTDEKKDLDNVNGPTPFGATIYWQVLSWPIKWVTGLRKIWLGLHVPLTLWFQYLPFGIFNALSNVWYMCKQMVHTRQQFLFTINGIYDMLDGIFNSYKMARRVYITLKKDKALRETFKAEYDALHTFFTSEDAEDIRYEIRDLKELCTREEPFRFFEVCNPFSAKASNVIAAYTRIEIAAQEEHDLFKKAVYMAGRMLYKAHIGRCIAVSSDYPLCVPTLLEEASKSPRIEIKAGYSPLLYNPQSVKPIVKNDVNLGGNQITTAAITGCNGAGKTTYLRLIGSNMVLASLGIGCGREVKYSLIGKIIYEANPEDSVKYGDSLFTYEAKRGRFIYETAQKSTLPILILADEPFSKTAVPEAEAFWLSIAMNLADLPCPTLLISSTHLTELPELVEKMDRKDFRFLKAEFIQGEGVTYKIIPGNVDEPLSNYILHALKGYPKEIVNLQENILFKSNKFKWPHKLQGYKKPKPYKKIAFYTLLILTLVLLLLLLFLFFRRYSFTITKRNK